MSKEAKKEFRRLAKQLLEVGLMTNIDVNSLAFYCDAYSDYQVVEDPRASKRLFDQMSKIASDFGFTPYSRARLAMPKKKKELSQFEKDFGDL